MSDKPDTPATNPTAPRDDPARVIQRDLNRYVRGYYFWFPLYLMLGIASIVAPALASLGFLNSIGLFSGFDKDHLSASLAAVGAISAAIFAFVKPNDYATAYGVAREITLQARSSYSLGAISAREVADKLEGASKIVRVPVAGLNNLRAP